MIDKKFFSSQLKIAIGTDDIRAFARRCKIDEKNIRNYLDGESLPTLRTLTKISEGSKKPIGWFTDKENIQPTSSDYCHVPLYNIQAAAGHGSYVDSEYPLDVVAFRTDWIKNELRLDPKQLSLIFVTGDSMEPTLHSGDIVLIDHSSIENINDGLWVIRMGSGPLVKRIQKKLDNKLVIKSDNKEGYDPIEIDLTKEYEDLEFIGRVVWHGGRI